MRALGPLLLSLALALSLLTTCRCARADGAPTSWIQELVQDGQEVQVTWLIPDSHLSSGQDLQRELLYADEYFSVDVLVDHLFDPEEAISSEIVCWVEPGADSIPDEDCDGDDVAECEGYCLTYYTFEVLDECVPPATWWYIPDHETADGETIEVEDTGDDCLGSYVDLVTDTGATNGDSCSVSGVGSRPPAGALVLLMLAVGAAGLVFSRRRW